MTLQEAFSQVMVDLRLTGKEVAVASGCTQPHISQFKNGGEITLAMLDRVLSGLEKLRPGSSALLVKYWLNVGSLNSTSRAEAITTLKSIDLTQAEIAEILFIASSQIAKQAKAEKAEQSEKELAVAC